MCKRIFLGAVLLSTVVFPVQAEIGIRLLLGVTDKDPAKWDGSVTVSSGSVSKIDSWRFGKGDEISGNQWTVSTRPVSTFLLRAQNVPPAVAANGVIVWLAGEDENTVVSVQTAQGSFKLKLQDLPYGKFQHLLAGRVAADRVPPQWQLTSNPDEQDYPAVAKAPNGDLWLAYLEFRHHPDHDKLRAPLTEAPKDFSHYTDPPGGDQVFVKRFTANQWGEPIAITPPGGDLYRPAIAVDGSGRPWVFWSANQNNNFDVWARPIESGTPGTKVQISKAPGADVFAVAATDASGRVWVAWQGWRDGKAAIFAATQQGSSFSSPAAVSKSTANEWNPAIAADLSGRVSIAWDSYRDGSYDVYARTASKEGVWGPEIPVAATARYEAYPSIAYDSKGRLWIAYEEGGEGWGKDFGALQSTGVSVYHARAIRVVGLDSTGSLVQPEIDPGTVLPGIATLQDDSEARQAATSGWERPDPALYTRRKPNDHPWPAGNPRNTLPRLTVDESGRLWLAFRSAQPVFWNPNGTVWHELVISFDGKSWTGPILLSRSDNILDNRPAVISRKAGDLVVIGSSDYRRELEHLIRQGWGMGPGAGGAAVVNPASLKDPYNDDLWASVISLPPAPSPIAASSLGTPPVPVPGSTAASDRANAAKARAYRVASQGQNLKVVRGEFHRHSEYSPDGGLDGTLIDQWRYLIDAASFDWAGCCDHDNGSGREYSWWTTQKLTDIFYSPGKFAPLFSYERSVQYPEGHRNVVFAQRGVRTLPRLPKLDPDSTGHAPDTQMFYAYLKQFNGVVASHTSGTNMGTDWRDNDPTVEPIVEIYQGMRQNYEMPGAPRSNTENDSIGGWRPKGFVNLALEQGYKLGFESSSDHISTHMSYSAVLAKDSTREAVLDGLRKRHVYAATADILADVRSGPHLFGDALSTADIPELSVKLSGTAPFAKIQIIKDNQYVYSIEPGTQDVAFRWRDNKPASGKTSYYYVRGEQKDGEIVWVSPFWITYTGK